MTEFKIALLLCTIFALPGAQRSERLSTKCTYGWRAFGVNCFKFVETPKTWAEAEGYCVDLGANLASVHSVLMVDFIKRTVKADAGSNVRCWLGGQDATQNDLWLWSDGSKYRYSNWANGEPNNDGGVENCMEMNYGGEGRWNDAPCHLEHPFVCMKRGTVSGQS